MRLPTVLFAACSVVAAGMAHAADPKLVTYYKETCGVCHGENGEGTTGLAPPLKGNKFVTASPDADIAAVITKGREGAAKHYKDLPSPMPPQSMSDSRLKALIAYLKTDLQK
jgi:mono/diheme cytochrome c family protein